ncbi:DUF86 domain-containing protein [Candidatus Pacearchaeota archaeon]|nr:DUF86 domain-containing protein [Candidatus Pacearchaeota archaeon]
MTRLNDEIINLENYLKELTSIIPNHYSEYQENFEKRAACERYFEKIVEFVVSISYLICRKESLEIDDKLKSFTILQENKIISKDLLVKLKDAKGMRNIIAHKYGEIDNLIVFETITKELVMDINEFLIEIKSFIE